MDNMTFVLFGATGDLAKRKIYPALYNLYREGRMPEKISVVGLGRREYTDSKLQSVIKEALESFSRREVEPSGLEEFLEKFRYCIFDATKPESYDKLHQFIKDRENELDIPDNRLFYLSVAPTLIKTITEGLHESGISSNAGWKRLMVEKPFGSDLETAQDLNKKLKEVFTEDEIFRIDHYLGKPMVQKLESLVHANPMLKALLDHDQISNVQITASETVGVGTRAAYYDQAGAIRDMVQNHLLQLVMMTALYNPDKMSTAEIEAEKRGIMESLKPITKENMEENVVRGQYAAGQIEGQAVPAYLEEAGVAEDSNNDTFFAARLEIDNENWKGIPFYIRTGKRMKKKSTRIVVEFKCDGDEEALKDDGIEPNLLIIEINPNESMTLKINIKNQSEEKFEPEYITFSNVSATQPEAYELLLHDAMQGNETFFAHWKEVELSWKWVQPLLDEFEKDGLPLYKYPAGSDGPEAAHQLLKEDGHKWWYV
ncbi:glucose-6-phosphate dehydrogenase [Halobacillus yeomjeoni]|uniref:glucose-6-phosphate dehydrogenase n=1 Tax=Halobacillus yeomjeoni TaxID=311194 RepID=UPI001CD2D7F2|nr:glucose-6-phosphate dehydrogenase [Halobacillus yeomjeoni]MCA0985196.1 glucose-6-phosphate dehydrogenase [Halobacillus yeomjeoni]